MMPIISEVARSVSWLLEHDPTGWKRGTHSVAHAGSRVGIWTANGVFFCNPWADVPRDDAERTGHILRGKEVRVTLIDKFIIWRAYKRMFRYGEPGIPRAISDYAEKKFNSESATAP